MDGNSPDHPPEHVHDQLQRPEPGNPVARPAFELPDLTSHGRYGLGWFLLSIILAMLISGSLVLYFTRNPYDVALRMYLQETRMREALGEKDDGASVLDRRIAELAPKRNEPEAAAYYVVMSYERGKPILADDL